MIRVLFGSLILCLPVLPLFHSFPIHPPLIFILILLLPPFPRSIQSFSGLNDAIHSNKVSIIANSIAWSSLSCQVSLFFLPQSFSLNRFLPLIHILPSWVRWKGCFLFSMWSNLSHYRWSLSNQLKPLEICVHLLFTLPSFSILPFPVPYDVNLPSLECRCDQSLFVEPLSSHWILKHLDPTKFFLSLPFFI